MGGPEIKLVKRFDKDKNGWLNQEERREAREAVKKEAATRPARGPFNFGGPGGPRGPGGPGGPGEQRGGPTTRPLGERRIAPDVDPGLLPATRPAGGFRIFDGPGLGPGGRGGPGGAPFGGRNREPAKPGPKVSVEEVAKHAGKSLYATDVLRTLFFEFESESELENSDWEAELTEFRNTDVDVPAKMIVDGKTYSPVGMHFRGASSFFGVSPGYKRSFNVAVDLTDGKQRLEGYKTLNLLNASGDPTFLGAVLYSHIARQYMPAPKVDLVKVVINGESWGIYQNAQQFNKQFLKEWFPSSKGIRWKAPGSPRGGAGLTYMGDDIEAYKRVLEIKEDNGKDAEKGWKALVELCRTLNQTPPDKLEAALEPMLDIDGVLKFLALEMVLINSDGYWTRSSDYGLFLDEKGKFHVIPHDMNEAFQPGRGPGMGGMRLRVGGPGGPGPGGRGAAPVQRGGGGGGGVQLDPLVGLDDASKPLRSKLLAVPALRERYLRHVRDIAQVWLDWKNLGPIVDQYAELIEKEVEADTRKLDSIEGFKSGVSEEMAPPEGGRRRMSYKQFADARRKYLLEHPEIKKLTP